jgi:hypothetical protein
MQLRLRPMKLSSAFGLLASWALVASVQARDLHVDPINGSDTNDGVTAPTKTISVAIRLAQPGDTVHLKPTVYRDYAGFYNKKGEPGKPVTLDGHGATLEGSDPIDPAKWDEVSPGLFANDALKPQLDDGAIGRWFFLWNGQMNRMGRTSKGASAPLKKPEELNPNEWTFVKDPSREKPPSRQIYGTFYLKLPPGKKLTDVSIFAPVRSAGVQMDGENAHLVIRNLTATHPYNDGFNIHGDCREVVFENIRAIECGDDGISAHETAEYRVDGFVSIGNSTGICDTVAAKTSYNRVFIADNIAFDLFFLDDGRYKLTNAIILSSAQNPFTVTGREDKRCELEIDNVYFRRIGPPKPALITATALLRGKRLTMENIDFDKRGELQIENSLVNGQPTPAGSPAHSANVREILATFSEDMRRDVLQRHSSLLLTRAVHRDGPVAPPVITAPGHCAWPNLKLLKDGCTLAAFIFNNDSHGHRPGDVECWISKDHGAQWNLASAATAHEPDTIRMNHAAGVANNGDLMVLTAGWSNRWPPGVTRTRGSYRYETLGPWLSRSSDEGKTWRVDKQLFPQTTPSGQPGTPFGDVVRAQNGDLCVSIYGTQAPWEKYEERRFRSWLYRSKDDGNTWGEPVVIGPDSNETNILHLGDGRWLACARAGTGVEKKDFMELYASTDDARTWTKKRVLTGYQRVNGHLLKLKNGSVLFTYGDRASANGRKGLEAMLSNDDGETWSDPIRLIDWNGLDGGYPSSIQRADGQIVTAYYSSALPDQPADSMKGYHMAVIVWDAGLSFPAP